MIRCAALLFTSVLAVACANPFPAEPPAKAETPRSAAVSLIRLGVGRFGNQDTVGAWHDLAALIEKRLGTKVSVHVAEPYKELPELFRGGVVDIVQFPPSAFAHAISSLDGVTVLATPVIAGSPTYLGHLYVREGSTVRTLSDLKGLRIGYVSPDSASGYLFPRALLRAEGLDPATSFSSSRFFDSHDAVLAAVKSGEVDVGAAIDTSSDWAGLTTLPDGLRVIGKSRRIPHDCVAARPGFDRSTALAFRGVLLSLRVSEPELQTILSRLHINGWVPTGEERYDSVRELMEREGRTARK